MRMSELVSSMGLSIFPIVGIIAFGLAFLFVILRIARTTKGEVTHNASIPLEDGSRPIAQTIPARTHAAPRAQSHGSDA